MLVLVSILTACMVFYGGFVFWSGWWFERIRLNKTLPDPLLPTVTVLIPARNEAQHLSRTLHSVLRQRYPSDKIEIILVNDHSTDGTRAIAQLLETRYMNFKVIDLIEEEKGKKAAIARGVREAKGDIILQMDADCYVADSWAAAMASQFVGHTAMVAGPIELTYTHHKIQRLQAIETMGLVALAGGAIGAGRPNMVNGANLAYTKAVFQEVNGFEGVDHVASGDDELLMQKIQRLRKYQIRFAKNRNAIVRTPSLSDWSSLRAQRLRWVSKARAYVNRRTNGIQLLSYLGFWTFPILLVLGFGDMNYWLWGLALIAWKISADFYLMHRAARFFSNFQLLKDFFLLELVYIPYVLWIGIAGNFVKSYNWKERWVT